MFSVRFLGLSLSLMFFPLFVSFLVLPPLRSFATLMLAIMHNSVALIISIMLSLTGSFQFRDRVMLCKNRNLLAQRPWHSIEATYNKQEEKKSQLTEIEKMKIQIRI